VQETLQEIDAGHIPTITALNKIDRLAQPEVARETVRNYPKSIAVSALSGVGQTELLHLIKQELYETYTAVRVRLSYQQGALISLFHEAGQVERIEHGRGGVLIQGRIPGRLAAQFSQWHVDENQPEIEEEEI
jgi:GTPase